MQKELKSLEATSISRSFTICLDIKGLSYFSFFIEIFWLVCKKKKGKKLSGNGSESKSIELRDEIVDLFSNP